MRRSVHTGLIAVLALVVCSPAAPGRKLERALDGSHGASETVRVIIQTADPTSIERLVRTLGGQVARRLTSVPAVVAELPGAKLVTLAAHPAVRAVSPDRRLQGAMERTGATIGSKWVNEHLGFDGSGIGVAIIDSGVSAAHDDLATRVVHFADFVDPQSQRRDGYGHGTHVAGIIAGSGQLSDGARRGVAPGAHLVVLKALDSRGDGVISNAIAAMDYAIAHRETFNIRVINLSVAAGVYESYKTDPLTLAAGRAVDAGIVVVTAAGNLGRNSAGRAQYGGITSPGNAPWVLTVGAATHNGTVDRSDDAVASFSSLGPSAIDLVAKPDLVAPGVGIESTADPGSTLFKARPKARLWGLATTPAEPYLSLSGTSMAAPVVAGTVALMMQANPGLTPGAVKAILQTTAEAHPGVNRQAQGAGFLNARAAVELARTFAESPAAAEVLDDLVAMYGPDEGAWTLPCSPSDVSCRYLVADCATGPGCFAQLAGAVAGSVTPSSGTTVWDRTLPAWAGEASVSARTGRSGRAGGGR